MNLLKRLTIKNLMLNKKRTIVTIIGIILSVALITAVASMYFSALDSLILFEKQRKGDYHIEFLDVSKNDLDDFKNNKNIEKMYITQDVGYANLEKSKNEYKPYAFVKEFTKDSMKNLGITLVEGRFPENENEILIPTHLKTNGRIDLKVGDEIKLNIGKRVDNEGYELNQENPFLKDDSTDDITDNENDIMEEIVDTNTKKYKIVGICERPSSEIENYSAPGYTFITFLNENKLTGNVDVFVRYTQFGIKNEKEITSNILGIDKQVYKNVIYGYDDNEVYDSDKVEEDFNAFDKSKYQIDVNSYLIRLESNPIGEDGGLNVVALIVCIIIIVTSVFCIKNSFDISITEKIRQYGMLRSMGATKKQIKKSVYFEAFALGIIGIPLGMLFGFLASYILIIISNHLLLDSFDMDFKLIFTFSWLATGVSIILGAITIWLSSVRSARKASKITPILAIRNSGDIRIKAKKLKTPKIISKMFGIGGEISYKNLKRNKKKYRTISISIIVVVAVFIAISYFSSLIVGSIKKEFNMQDYNIEVYLNYNDTEKDVKEILNLENIDEISVLKYKYMNIKNLKYTDEYWDYIKGFYASEEEALESRTGQLCILAEGTYREYIKDLGLKYDDVKDKVIIYNRSSIDFRTEDNKVKVKKVDTYDYKVGDNIKYILNDSADNKEKSMEVAKLTDKCPFGLYDGYAAFIVSDSIISSLNAEYLYTNIYIDSSNADKLQDDIEEIVHDKEFSINNNEENVRTMRNLFLLVAIFVYGFIIVISLIGVTNIFNTITTSMELRRQEFASLRSIGMTDKEFSRMIRLESVFLGFRSLIIGIPIGIGLSYLIYHFFINSLEEIVTYKLPILPIIIAVVAVFLLITIIMKYSLGKIKKQNIIETIRNENI